MEYMNEYEQVHLDGYADGLAAGYKQGFCAGYEAALKAGSEQVTLVALRERMKLWGLNSVPLDCFTSVSDDESNSDDEPLPF